jgi:hypothetical protein
MDGIYKKKTSSDFLYVVQNKTVFEWNKTKNTLSSWASNRCPVGISPNEKAFKSMPEDFKFTLTFSQ